MAPPPQQIVFKTLLPAEPALTSAEIEASLPPPPCALRQTCNHCEALEDESIPCVGCGMVVYCCPDHRLDDLDHDAQCLDIQRMQRDIRKAGTPDPSKYTAQHVLVSFLYNMDTYNALAAALMNALEILKNDRRDRFDIREEVPFILLRLGQDQVCYDFCVAWTNEEQMYLDPAVTYDFEDVQPFAIASQDMLDMYEYRFDVENKDYFPHAVAMVLLKLRLLMRMMCVPETRALSAVKNTVAEHLKSLCNSITAVVPDFWPKVINEIKQASEPRDDVMFGGLEAQVVRALVLSFPAWKESPGAVELLEGLMTETAPLLGATAAAAVVVDA